MKCPSVCISSGWMEWDQQKMGVLKSVSAYLLLCLCLPGQKRFQSLDANLKIQGQLIVMYDNFDEYTNARIKSHITCLMSSEKTTETEPYWQPNFQTSLGRSSACQYLVALIYYECVPWVLGQEVPESHRAITGAALCTAPLAPWYMLHADYLDMENSAWVECSRT